MAREKPNTCESIHAERIAMVLPGCSGDVLYTTFSTTLCKEWKEEGYLVVNESHAARIHNGNGRQIILVCKSLSFLRKSR